MTKPLLGVLLRKAVRHLARHAVRRARAEAKVEADFQARRLAVETEFTGREKSTQEVFSSAQTEAIRVFQETTHALEAQFTAKHGTVAEELADAKRKADRRYSAAKERLEAEYEETRWTVETVLEADKKVAKDEQVVLQRSVGTAVQSIHAGNQEILRLVSRWQLADVLRKVSGPPVPGKPAGDGPTEPQDIPELEEGLKQRVAVVEKCHEQLRRSIAPHLLKGYRLTVLFVLLWLVLQVPVLWWLDLWYWWVAATSGAILCIGVMVRYVLAFSLRTRVVHLGGMARRSGAEAETLQKRCLEGGTTRYQQRIQLARKTHDEAYQHARETFQRSLNELEKQNARAQEQVRATYEPQLEKLQKQRDQSLQKNEARYQKAMADSTERFDQELEEATQLRDQQLAENRHKYEDLWQALAREWEQAVQQYLVVVRLVKKDASRLFPDWEALLDYQGPPPAAVPLGIRFGTLDVRLEHFPDGVPQDERLHATVPPPLSLPALLDFPYQGSLLLKTEGEGRARGIELLQAVMLRCLAAIPPGKVRFTIIDPVGLGESFAAFAHLADFDEKLVTSRIWTEPGHIEQRLADLTEHIENVIQKYLRNQFETLEEYNAQAGEVAEPYRILVIANFPVNFTEESGKRLVSIAQSGLRCGIHMFVLVDTKQKLPDHFDLNDLERNSTVLIWEQGKLQWRDADMGRFPMELDTPPPAEVYTALVRRVAEQARFASRVEVPFPQIAPPAADWWKGDTRSGIRVPLGKAGATRKQLLELGEGTAQHVLVAGKTGSGKSTLLHALILQLALTYNPDEVELYLVDFKKGVEFKTYAVHELPHARVVAVESEREFGLSVLQRLDAELKVRGEQFRNKGVNDIASYRDATGQPLPRVMLIVDEFQEFFVEDDRIAQEAALLLDRLVRQGRAFGLHVLLGSQTLGGAYSLARSTIDQMAVRVALQCSETDGHLILSKENNAARLLSRPGEAIYNDANGLVEGNNLFQVVWISDSQRDQYLDQVQRLAVQHPPLERLPQIVFEGNAPALLAKNLLLQQLLEAPSWPANGTGYPAWLGDSIAIKDPTTALFRRHSGSNLILIGQHGEAALSILTAACLSLGAGLPPAEDAEPRDRPRFFLLSDSSENDTADQLFRQVADTLPQPVEVAGWREMPTVLQEVMGAVDRRLTERDATAAPLFLVVYGLQQFRDLRRQEDEFGLSRRGDDKSPSRLFTAIVRDGPPLGVFTLVWCDTLNNVQRFVDRQLLREFEMRVLFQMNANDSSNLIDAPVASRLGLHRALFYTEDQGRLEKFRPYGLPEPDWLAWVKKQLARQSVAASEG